MFARKPRGVDKKSGSKCEDLIQKIVIECLNEVQKIWTLVIEKLKNRIKKDVSSYWLT